MATQAIFFHTHKYTPHACWRYACPICFVWLVCR